MGLCCGCIKVQEEQQPLLESAGNKNRSIIQCKKGVEFRMERLSDHLDLFDEACDVITSAFVTGPTAEPLTKCAGGSCEEFRFFAHQVLNRMKDNNNLHTVFLLFENKTNELVSVNVCDDLFDPSNDLDDDDIKEIQQNAPSFIAIFEFLDQLTENGVKKLETEFKSDDNTATLREIGRVFHVFMRGMKKEYLGRGLTTAMYRSVLTYAKNKGFRYCCHETTSAITQHINKKYANAKEYNSAKYSDHFENYNYDSLGVDKDQVAMFQVVDLKTTPFVWND
eukprot:134300_1